MRVKQVLKKTLTAGMLALMACTSMSAMAAPEWVWTSQELRGAGKTFDEICEAVVASRAHTAGPWKVEYLGSWYLVSDRTVYCRAINELDNLNFVSGGFVCDKGKFFFNDPDRPDGCYEFKEPEPVPPMEENDPICDGKGYKDDIAGVACDSSCTGPTCQKDSARTCVWIIDPYFTTDESRARYSYCVRRHEQQHIDDWDAMGSYCDPNSDTKDRKATPRPNLFLSEYRAYQDSIRCFEEQKEQCNTKSCADQMEQGIISSTGNMNKARTRYEDNCKPNCVPLN